MKRHGNLYEKIANIENLKLAYYKAKKGRSLSKSALLYRYNLEENIKLLRSDLINGNVKVGNYNYFTIYDPKERVICAASFNERVLHHAIINIIESIFDSYLIYDSYACRVGKGSHSAILKAFHFSKRYKYFLKLDIRKYFDSIDHEILYGLLERKLKDKRLLKLLKLIIDSYSVTSGIGIPIGNLTSQYFANFYMGFFDHYVKEVLGIKPYVRYMDDFVLWSNSSDDLKIVLKKIESFVYDKLHLNIKEPYLNRVTLGVPFLGFLIKNSGIFMLRRSKYRFIKKLKSYKSLEDNSDNISSMLAHISIARTNGFRVKYLIG